MLNTANIYVDLLNKIKESGGAVPPELVEEVEALNVTVNGDETTEPPTIGLVDIVADLGDEVENLDIDINGDDTTEPPAPGLKDRVADLETTINGDPTTTPETPGLSDRVDDLDLSVNGDPEATPPVLPALGNVRLSMLWENSDPTQNFAAGNITLSSDDYELAIMITDVGSVVAIKGGNTVYVSYEGTLSSVNYIFRRGFSCSGSSATITNCVALKVSDGSDSTNNAKNIPYRIYGIKLLY